MGLGRWADGAASGAKENQAVRSEASYLIFRPASVAKSCEAHEALTFWLLLGQAKSDGEKVTEKLCQAFSPCAFFGCLIVELLAEN